MRSERRNDLCGEDLGLKRQKEGEKKGSESFYPGFREKNVGELRLRQNGGAKKLGALKTATGSCDEELVRDGVGYLESTEKKVRGEKTVLKRNSFRSRKYA